MAAQAAIDRGPAGDLTNPWLRTYFTSRLAALDTERSSYFDTWRDISQQFAPYRGRFWTSRDSQRGRRKDQRLINNTGLLASRTLASGMQAGITSPAEPWFLLRVANQAVLQDADIRFWLDDTRDRLLDIIARSNLYNALHTLYGNLGDFGTAALWVDEDSEDIVRGYVLSTGEYWLGSSARMAVDTIYRTMWWSVRQIVTTFGRDAVSPAVRSAYDNGRLDLQYEIVQAVEPNPNAMPANFRAPSDSPTAWNGHLSSMLPWRSVWFERGSGESGLLRTSGFHEFPCMAPRWEIDSNDTYGFGPGHVAIGDSQALQILERRSSEVADKLSKPPMVGPPDLNNKPSSLLPGGLTIVSDTTGKSFRAAFEVRAEAVQAISESVIQKERRINSAFYADLFLMMMESDRREITAREVDERHEEKMLMLGPVLERLYDELLDPLVKRVFNIAARNGLIPPPPPGLRQQDLQVEFVSILAQAQKAVATRTMERFVQMTGQLVAVGFQGAGDRLDVDEYIDTYADRLGVPPKIVVPAEEAQKARDARAKQQADAAALAQANALATIGQTASQIDVGGGQNAVSAMVGGGPSP